jgi:RHS repeat-associated protein
MGGAPSTGPIARARRLTDRWLRCVALVVAALIVIPSTASAASVSGDTTAQGGRAARDQPQTSHRATGAVLAAASINHATAAPKAHRAPKGPTVRPFTPTLAQHALWSWGNGDGGIGEASLGQDGVGPDVNPLQVCAPATTSPCSTYLSGITNMWGGSSSEASYAATSSSIYSWGRNDCGQLGDGTSTYQNDPVAASLFSGLTAQTVAMGQNNTLVLATDGSVYSVGCNSNGELGDGTTTSTSGRSYVRSHVCAVGQTAPCSSFLTNVVAVAAGPSASYAVKGDGTAYAWGTGSSGELGNNGTTGSTVPVQICATGTCGSFLSGIKAITANSNGAYALGSDGTVWTWGDNYNNRLGDGDTVNTHAEKQLTPTHVCAVASTGTCASSNWLSNVGAISAGILFGLALRTDGTVAGWGRDFSGELGDNGSSGEVANPVVTAAVGGAANGRLTGVTNIAAGGYFSLATDSSGNVYGWGDNSWGQLGNNGVGTTSSSPVLSGKAGGTLSTVTQVAAGSQVALAGSTNFPLGGANTGPSTRGGGSRCAYCDAVHGNGYRTQYPINTSTGEFFHSFTDFVLPGRGRSPFFTRTYSSAAAVASTAPGLLSAGWIVSAGASLQQDPTTKVVTFNEENGAQDQFFPTSGGVNYTTLPRVNATLTWTYATSTFTLTRNMTDVLTFTMPSGNTALLQSDVDLDGQGINYHYTSGQLTSLTDASMATSARTISLTYCTGTSTCPTGRLASVTDGSVRSVSFSYDSNGNLSSSTDGSGGSNRVTSYTYVTPTGLSGHYLMQTMTLPNNATSAGHIVRNDYDTNYRVDWQKDQTDASTYRQTTFVYNSDGSTVTQYPRNSGDPTGVQVRELYQYGLRVSSTSGYACSCSDTQTTTYSYDPATLNLLTTTLPRGGVITNAYDTYGNKTSVTDALNHVTSMTYNGLNEVTSVTDPLQTAYNTAHSTTYASDVKWFDAKGNLLEDCKPLNPATAACPGPASSAPAVGTGGLQITLYNYGDAAHSGDVTSIIDPLGYVWERQYDTAGDLTSASDPLGDTTTTTYDAIGRVVSETSPRGNSAGSSPWRYTTTTAYTQWNQLSSVTDPLHHSSSMTYDLDGNVLASTDANGNTTTNTYDGADQLRTTIRPDSTVLTTDYNADGTVADQLDGLSDKTAYTYDAQDRLITTVTPKGNVSGCGCASSYTTTLTYDGDGNVTSRADPDHVGNPTSFTHNLGGQLTAITYGDAGVTPNVSSITYDADGQRISQTDGIGSEAWSWDLLHRLTSSTDGNSNAVCYGYDIAGNRTSMTYLPGTNCLSTPASTYHTVSRSYDPAGRLSVTTDWLGNSTTTGYDADSNLISASFPGSVVDTNGYDPAGRLVSMSDAAGSSAPFASFSYGRDPSNRLTNDPGSLNGSAVTAGPYTYNSLNELTGTASTSYAYNAADELTTNKGNAQTFDASGEVCWSVSGASTNACASPPTGATTYTYDNRGDRGTTVSSAGAGTCDTYDQAGRLTAIKTGTGSSCTSPTTVGTYSYNGDGIRLAKTVSGTTSQFVWDVSGGLPMLLRDGPSGSQTSYVYGPGGLPIEQITAGGTAYFYHHDQLGSTRAITTSTGTVQNTYTFDSYGNLAASSGTLANQLLFSGEYKDSESALYYLRARYYDPSTGQFMSRDPLVDTTMSPYAYVAGNPLNWTDPTGASYWDGIPDAFNYIADHLKHWLAPISRQYRRVGDRATPKVIGAFGEAASAVLRFCSKGASGALLAISGYEGYMQDQERPSNLPGPLTKVRSVAAGTVVAGFTLGGTLSGAFVGAVGCAPIADGGGVCPVVGAVGGAGFGQWLGNGVVDTFEGNNAVGRAFYAQYGLR